MDVQDKIYAYITGQPEAKRNDMHALHRIIQQLMLECKLCLDGWDGEIRFFQILISGTDSTPSDMPMERSEYFIKYA